MMSASMRTVFTGRSAKLYQYSPARPPDMIPLPSYLQEPPKTIVYQNTEPNL